MILYFYDGIVLSTNSELANDENDCVCNRDNGDWDLYYVEDKRSLYPQKGTTETKTR